MEAPDEAPPGANLTAVPGGKDQPEAAPDDRSEPLSNAGPEEEPVSPMRVLIVESETQLGWIWKRHFDRHGSAARLVHGQEAAIECLRNETYDVIVLDLVLTEGSALAIADFANYRQPSTRVIFVTNTSFFSDGSIFQHATNACALMNSKAPPSDIAAMVEHFGAEARQQNARLK